MLKKHSFTKIPKDIKKEGIVDAILSVIMIIGFDFFTFFLQLGKEQVVKGHVIAGLSLITLFYISNTLQKFLDLWFSDIKQIHQEHYISVIQQKIVSLLLKCSKKVYKHNPDTETLEVMNNNVLIETSKNYVRYSWDLKLGIPSKITQLISLLILFFGFVVVTDIEIEHKGLFLTIIIFVLLFSVLFSWQRIKIRKKNRVERKSERELQTTWENDLMNIQSVSEKHSSLMAERFILVTEKLFKIERRQRKSFNKINVISSFVNSLAIITVIVIKVYEVGLDNVDLTVVLSIISLVTIFSQILNRITSIVRIVEEFKGNIDDIKTYENDFKNILEVYDEEDDVIEEVSINNFELPKFSVTYKQKGKETPFTLENDVERTYKPNDMILATGPTGSGKSTLLKMVSGEIRFSNFKLPKNVNAIMHQTDSKLGGGSVLSEIILSDSFDFDEDRLIEILKGLKLYDSIAQKNKDVISHLTTSKYEDYSSGQKQRLVIARLLYNLDDTIKIVAFDEATNALNDDICKDVMMYIKDFCSDKIVFVATHQVNIVEPMCTAKICFEEHDKSFKVV